MFLGTPGISLNLSDTTWMIIVASAALIYALYSFMKIRKKKRDAELQEDSEFTDFSSERDK